MNLYVKKKIIELAWNFFKIAEDRHFLQQNIKLLMFPFFALYNGFIRIKCIKILSSIIFLFIYKLKKRRMFYGKKMGTLELLCKKWRALVVTQKFQVELFFFSTWRFKWNHDEKKMETSIKRCRKSSLLIVSKKFQSKSVLFMKQLKVDISCIKLWNYWCSHFFRFYFHKNHFVMGLFESLGKKKNK